MSRQFATHVKLQCFCCDHTAVKRLDALPFEHLFDYACPGCRRTGTTHIVRVETSGVAADGGNKATRSWYTLNDARR